MRKRTLRIVTKLEGVGTLVVLALLAVAVYLIPWFQHTSVKYLSLVQWSYLLFVPLLAYPWVVGYVLKVLKMPRRERVFVSDAMALVLIGAAMVFMYGGLGVHAVTKTMSYSLRYEPNFPAGEMNRFFHLTFTHNLVFSSLVLLGLGFVMLEMNHERQERSTAPVARLIQGLLLSLALFAGMYLYTRPVGDYAGRWSDLRVFYFVTWLSAAITGVGLFKARPSWRQSYLLLAFVTAIGAVALGLLIGWLV